MASYTNRTCAFCGIKKPQPEMRQMKLKMEVGGSRPSASAATFLGAMLDDKRSKRAVQNTIFNAGARKHFRNKVTWVCMSADCQKTAKRHQQSSSEEVGIGGIVIFGILLIGALVLLGGDGSESESRAVPASVQTSVTAQSSPEADLQPSLQQSGFEAGELRDDTEELASVEDEVTLPEIIVAQPERNMIESEFRGAQHQSRIIIQRKLAERGLYRGEIDGLFGAGTMAALVEAARTAKTTNEGISFDNISSVRSLFDMIVLDQF